MKTLAALLAALALSWPVAAGAQNVAASRVFKLCLMEDPSCMGLVRGAHARVMAQQAKAQRPVVCPHGYRMTDAQIITTFMQIGQTEPAALSVPLDQFETYVLSYALPCR
jgi:hypothetical protein